MILKTLKTSNFRNLCDEPIFFDEGINVLCGENAVGKTNTLEAVYLFATGKSFRTRNEKDFINHAQSLARAQIKYCTKDYEREMSITYMANGAKAIKGMQIEGSSVERVSEFLGNFRAVLFTPDHLELVKGAPEERRKLVDMALCQIQPRFVRALNEYTKVLSQRNNYLKGIKLSGKRADEDYLAVLNEQLALSGAVITKQRGLYCKTLSEYARQKYAFLTGNREKLVARYVTKATGVDISDEKALCDFLLCMYKKDTARDIEMGKTSHGPHHDELMIYLSSGDKAYDEKERVQDVPEEKVAEYAARTFASQGQQRSAVLAIKLAEGEIIKQKCSEYPVFLLDDLFSELDGARRERISEMFCDKQCVITCCDRGMVPEKGAKIITVKDGKYSI